MCCSIPRESQCFMDKGKPTCTIDVKEVYGSTNFQHGDTGIAYSRDTRNTSCDIHGFVNNIGDSILSFMCSMNYFNRNDIRENETFTYINVSRTFLKTTGILQYLNILSYPMHSGDVPNSVCDEATCTDDNDSYIVKLKTLRRDHGKYLICGHMNINGIRNKFTEICDMFTMNLMDIFVVGETKIDESFPKSQFKVPGYKTLRADRNQHGGGIMTIIRDDIPCRRLANFEIDVPSPIESIIFEILIRGEKWLYVCIYNPNNRHKHLCCDVIDRIMSRVHEGNYSMVWVLGDLNINMECPQDSQCLKDVMETNSLRNLILSPTCFKTDNGTLLDVILTTNKNRVSSVFNLPTGVSDFHNMIGFISKLHVPRRVNHDIV